jgi:hypothetical protein
MGEGKPAPDYHAKNRQGQQTLAQWGIQSLQDDGDPPANSPSLNDIFLKKRWLRQNDAIADFKGLAIL